MKNYIERCKRNVRAALSHAKTYKDGWDFGEGVAMDPFTLAHVKAFCMKIIDLDKGFYPRVSCNHDGSVEVWITRSGPSKAISVTCYEPDRWSVGYEVSLGTSLHTHLLTMEEAFKLQQELVA